MASTLTVTPPRRFELDEYNTHSYTLFILRFILILFTHLLRSLPSGLCLSGFPTIIVFTFLVFSMRVTCFAYLILDFIAVIMSDVEYSLLVAVETECCDPFSSFIIYHYDLGLPECTVAVGTNTKWSYQVISSSYALTSTCKVPEFYLDVSECSCGCIQFTQMNNKMVLRNKLRPPPL
jgi:hypothetical protein